MNRQKKVGINRRDFLKISGIGSALTAAGVMSPLSQLIAQASGNKFLLYIHAGSWDGFAAGLLQPKDVNVFAKGVFQVNRDAGSVNPNINKHYKDGNLILNDYSKVMSAISNHVCFAAGNPTTVGHFQARNMQSTGSTSTTFNPGWASGLAQVAMGTKKSAFVVDGLGIGVGNASSPAVNIVKTTPQVVMVGASTTDDIQNNFSDPSAIRTMTGKNAYTNALLTVQNDNYNKMAIDSGISGSISSSIDAISKGVPDVSARVAAIESALSRANIDGYIDSMADKVGVKSVNFESELRDKLKIAALLIETGLGSGMSIMLPNHDMHGGGSSVVTARASGQLWAQLVVFWNWVKSKGLENDVMVIVSHEFSRSAYNTSKAAAVNVVYDNAGTPTTIPVEAPGTDHALAFGMVFINGRVPAKSRIGGIGDYYTVAGSADLKGIASSSIPAYTSLQLVASMMKRVWPGYFPSFREIRKIWPNFTEADLVQMLIE